MSEDTVNSKSYRRDQWRWNLRSLLLLLAVWGVLSGEIWSQSEKPLDSSPIREPIFVIDDGAGAVALQNDGKIVAAGASDRGFAVVRYHPDGSLDPSFGTAGKVKTRFGTVENIEDAFADMALQADGKIVVVGRTWQEHSNDFALVRYNPDGSLDTNFGRDGIVTTDFTPPGTPPGFGPSYDEAFALAIQADGKLVVGGEPCLARYNPDGSLDTSFGRDGQVRGRVRALALQRDGKIVVVGPEGTFALARYHPDGSLDTSFGTGGKVTSRVGTVDAAGEVTIQTDGKLVVVGTSFNGRSIDLAMVRYNPDGSVDTSFGTGGQVTSDFCAHQIEERYAQDIGPGTMSGGWRVGLQVDGKIVVTGTPSNALCSGSVMFRSHPDGSPDATFGENGRVITPSARNDGSLSAFALQGDGKIVVVGTSGRGFAAARYNPDGSLDPTFGQRGRVTTRIGTGYILQ